MKAYERMGMNIYINELGHITKMAATPIYGKNFKNLLIQNKCSDDLETWYVASGTSSSTKIVHLMTLG